MSNNQLITKSLMFICLSLLVVSCATAEREDMKSSLDKRIGQPAPNYKEGRNQHYQYRDIDDKTYELIWKRPDACSYVLEINKLERTISGWHYFESNPPSDCKFQNFRELM
jgi:hypothetical protein